MKVREGGRHKVQETFREPTVSVVVITRNRPAMVERCLAHVDALKRAPLETIVVDASDGDGTGAAVSRHEGVKYLHLADAVHMMPRSRNEGIRAASGDVVAFIDDDSLVSPEWIGLLAHHYRDPKVGGVGGLVLSPGEEPLRGGPVGQVTGWGTTRGPFNVVTPGPLSVEHLRGCNMSFRRALLCQLGGFDERYDGSNYREETDMCIRVRRAGYALVYDPEASVVHIGAPKGFFDRDRKGERAFRISVARNNIFFRLRHFPGPATVLAAFAAGPLLQIALAMAGRQRLDIAVADIRGRLTGLVAYIRDHGAPKYL